jgi:hypothetical protein
MLGSGALLGIGLSSEILIKGLPDRHGEAVGVVHHLLLEEVGLGSLGVGTPWEKADLLIPGATLFFATEEVKRMDLPHAGQEKHHTESWRQVKTWKGHSKRVIAPATGQQATRVDP